jgi:hypothetical protein
MTWYLLLAPLAVLVILPLFAFVGCGAELGAIGPDYPTTIEDTPGLVAYWRLGEPFATPVPSSGGAAKSEVVGFSGDYFELAPAVADTQYQSPDTAGKIALGVTPGLLEFSDSPCILVDGGYVRIPANDALNPPVFTFECWIDFTSSGYSAENPNNYFYCLVESTGPKNGLEPRSTGFGLYLGPKDASTPGYFWQVWMGDGTQFKQVAVADKQATDVVDQQCGYGTGLNLTYLVLTFNGNNNSVNDVQGHDLNFNVALYLYRPDTSQNLTVPCIQALSGTVNNFAPNIVANGGGGDFFIGTGSNLFPGAVVAPSFVQVNAATSQTTVQAGAVTYPAAQTAGNLNIVVVGWSDTAATVQSVTDTAGNVYTLAIGPTTGTGLSQSIYFAANIKGGSNIVTVTFSQAAQTPDIRILEYAGVAGEGALDQTAGGSGKSATSQCGPVTTTAANELIFAANTVATGTKAAGSGYTSRIITAAPGQDIAEDQMVGSIGSLNATASLTASGNWVMQMVTFRAGPSQRLYPFKGKIQEVAFYNADLSVDTNALALQSVLGPHETAGGNF